MYLFIQDTVKCTRGFYFRETSSVVKIKPLPNGIINLSFTDVVKSCPSSEFQTSQICLLTLFAKKNIANISIFTVNEGSRLSL